jgi:hypothetical protein
MTNHHDHNIRKWIHRCNQHGINCIISKKHNHKQHKFADNMEKKIVDIEHLQIRDLLVWGFLHDGHYMYGLAFLYMI